MGTGLPDCWLIAHAMIDDNVPFEDSVNMTRRLIELHKSGWSIASHPTGRHGFVRPDAWFAEYRRIGELFETTLKP